MRTRGAGGSAIQVASAEQDGRGSRNPWEGPARTQEVAYAVLVGRPGLRGGATPAALRDCPVVLGEPQLNWRLRSSASAC